MLGKFLGGLLRVAVGTKPSDLLTTCLLQIYSRRVAVSAPQSPLAVSPLSSSPVMPNCNPHTMLKMSYDLCIIISLFNQSGLPQSSHAHHRVNPQIIINSAKKEFNKRLLGIFKTYQIRFFWNTGIPSAIQLLVVNSCCWQDWLILGVFADSGLDLLQCKCKPVLSSQVLGRIVFVLHLSEESSTSVATSKAEQEFVKNIFGVISQLPDYLHPSFNLRIHFFPLVSNSQSCL
nr:hypothetical protein TorRG33x02_095190 [Ipomoea batatas]